MLVDEELHEAKQRLRADGFGAFNKGEEAERAVVVTGDENPDDAAEGNTVTGVVLN